MAIGRGDGRSSRSRCSTDSTCASRRDRDGPAGVPRQPDERARERRRAARARRRARRVDARLGGRGRRDAARRTAARRLHLPDFGAAPDFAGTQRWFNTAGGRPLTLRELRGRVVLIDFWTYTCINCLRTLPYLKAWDARYRARG